MLLFQDVIMKDFNSIDYAVLYNPDNDKWHNNTVCQDRNDINGGGPTPVLISMLVLLIIHLMYFTIILFGTLSQRLQEHLYKTNFNRQE